MATFAVIENNVVTNTIVAASLTIAETITGKTCVEYTDEPAETGGKYVDGVFIQRKPYPSWISHNVSYWKAPVDLPTFDPENPKNYVWDESITNWVESPIV
jgi:hypothetical protein